MPPVDPPQPVRARAPRAATASRRNVARRREACMVNVLLEIGAVGFHGLYAPHHPPGCIRPEHISDPGPPPPGPPGT
ncbi:hypothetical protein GCM10010504_43360 [Streptomyces griseus]|nr:hypothetical protein GCM10010504_43360 [Streptomyces griseus]